MALSRKVKATKAVPPKSGIDMKKLAEAIEFNFFRFPACRTFYYMETPEKMAQKLVDALNA